MRVLYTSDNEPAAEMELATLITNFNETGGFQFRHNESDLRHELDSRGWYEGLHDCGHYLVLNLDRMALQLAPDHPHHSRESAAKLDAIPAYPAHKPSTFHDWLNQVEAKAAQSPVGATMIAAGFKIAHTGGGCLAWEKATADGWSVWICDEGNGLGDTLTEPYGTLFQDLEGDVQLGGPQEATLAQCIAWADETIRDPAAAVARGEYVPCTNHRDNGRGICCDCGVPL